MIFFIIFLIIFTLILNIFLVRKIKNKSSRVTLFLCNMGFFLMFLIFLLFYKFSPIGFNSLLDNQLENIEKKVTMHYPDILTKELDISQLKNILQNVLDNNNVEMGFSHNVVYKSFFELSDSTLDFLKSVSNQANKITMKKLMINLKELALNKFISYLLILRNISIVMYSVYILISLIINLVLLKNPTRKNKSIVFGEESDSVFIGMENKN